VIQVEVDSVLSVGAGEHLWLFEGWSAGGNRVRVAVEAFQAGYLYDLLLSEGAGIPCVVPDFSVVSLN